MNITFTEHQKDVLNEACLTFGTQNQISVIAEELQELAIVCLKLTRYGYIPRGIEELYPRVVDELTDVFIVIEYIEKIFGVQKEDILKRLDKKVGRIERWVNAGSLEASTQDRDLK